MSTFYTILMLMLIVLPPVFKAIEKSLLKAGEEGKARQVRNMRDILFEGDDKEDSPESYEQEVFPDIGTECRGNVAETGQVKTTEVPAIPQELLEGGYLSVREIAQKRRAVHSKQMTEPAGGEETEKKLDPKKLILYSEIMKTKF